jgi:hypothetical protein
MDRMKEVVVIGDCGITVKADEVFVSVSVDEEEVLFMDREAQFGLQQLVDALQSLII